MLKDVLECRDTLDEFYQSVWNAVIADYWKFLEKVQLGKIYKITPVSATLEMPITVSGELLQAKIFFSKVDQGLGQISEIIVEGFGKVPILTMSDLPVNGF